MNGVIEKGDWIVTDDGVIRGQVISEGFIGNKSNRIDCWLVDIGESETPIPKEQCRLWCKDDS